MRQLLLAITFAVSLAGCRVPSPPDETIDGGGALSALVFTRTLGYRHGSIVEGRQLMSDLAVERGWSLLLTESEEELAAHLEGTDVLIFLCTSGDVLSAEREAAVETFVRRGGGFVGVHSAADTEYDWPFYLELVGAQFKSHPPFPVQATLRVEDTEHPSTAHLGSEWKWTEEWYNFRQNPRAGSTVLLAVDEQTYSGGDMGADHPIAWTKQIDKGRSFFTALGHMSESYAAPAFRSHLAGAIEWAAKN